MVLAYIGLQDLLIGVSAALVAYIIFDAIYQLYFSPLAKLPGPWYAAISGVWIIAPFVKGQAYLALDDLHKKYVTDHDIYKRRRKAYGSAFTTAHLSQLEPVVHKHVSKTVQKIKEEMDNGGTPEILTWYQRMVTDVIGEISFGSDFGMVDSQKVRAQFSNFGDNSETNLRVSIFSNTAKWNELSYSRRILSFM
ncbi:hypothetical protein AA313_de0203879 [Arthrobotrys entomopaga]|nr:hypothetical protein AA313_de0203879 [Arthrobotrys entomopaga]